MIYPFMKNKEYEPRTHKGRDHQLSTRGKKDKISIRSPMKGEMLLELTYLTFMTFQSTRPYGARQVDDGGNTHYPQDFNPLARMGRDVRKSNAD